MSYLNTNNFYKGRSEFIMKEIEPESIALSFWSPPYFVGKEYEKNETFDTWQSMLKSVIAEHRKVLKPGGFMVINMADILCFKDASIPRYQALNIQNQKVKITRDEVLEAQKENPSMNRRQLATILGCSEQTIDRRLNGNNIRGGKSQAETRVLLVGGYIEKYAYDNGLYLYDKRIWAKDPAWANSRWTSNTLKAVSEYEDIYIFWKPGEQTINRNKINKNEWKEWGLRGIWHISSVRSNLEHEAQFPIALAERVVKLYSDKGDTVLDPFLGSGTTAIAAAKLERNYIGIEKEQKYIDLAEANLKKHTSQLKFFN